MLKKIPNILTIGRILIVPFFVLAFYLPGFYGDLTALILFIVASFTDFLDGMLARLLGEESKLGELLDPIADKIIVATDDQRVKSVSETFGATAIMTSVHHESGSDRIAEVAKILDAPDNQIIVNLQGDEPLMDIEDIKNLYNQMVNEINKDSGFLTNVLSSST